MTASSLRFAPAVMTGDRLLRRSKGPFRADQLRSGDPYELSNGHPVPAAAPAGGRASRALGAGALAIGTDPAVREVGADTGYAITRDTLRAPDLAVGLVPNAPGWVEGVPPLAVEYADTGQDEDELQAKIGELLGAGTRFVWVVRLTGPRRVEVYAADSALAVKTTGQTLEAPGILANAVPVDALFDADAAQAVALRNLLQRYGYAGIEAIRDEGREEGRHSGAVDEARAALYRVLEARGFAVDLAVRARIDAEIDREVLATWLVAAVTASSAGQILG